MLPQLFRHLVSGASSTNTSAGSFRPRSRLVFGIRNPDAEEDSDYSDEDEEEELVEAIFRLSPAFFAGLFEYLDGSDQVAVLGVCSEWAEAAVPALYASPPLPSAASFPHLIRLLSLSAAPESTTFFEYHTLVEALVIKGDAADAVEMGDVETALGLCANLRRFDLMACLHVSSKVVQSLADYAPHLASLSLESCPVGDGYMADLVAGCPNLQAVNLSHTNVSFASFDVLLSGLIHLKELHVDAMIPAEVEPVNQLSANGRPRRASFVGSPPPPPSTQRRALKLYPKGPTALKLQFVSIVGGKPEGKDLKDLGVRAPNLKTVLLSGSECLTDGHVSTLLDQLAAPTHGQSHIQLETLDLDGCPLITSATVHKITSVLAGVAKLGAVEPPTHNKPTNMLDLIDGIGRLKFMTLSPLKNVGLSETEVDANSIRTLVQECGSLVEVRLDGCDLISGTFIESVARDCWTVLEAKREEAQRKISTTAAVTAALDGVDMARKSSQASRLPVPVKRSAVIVIGGVNTPPASPPQLAKKAPTIPHGWCRLIGVAAIKRVADHEGAI
ncbi:UNVERIFIED_CONTAM: hypothetical protein HDU68_000183 [Siphonaria sp. JEL0065]|nr:hypothetical protein HDU68_000183 [Siphonaria sp. JEL0065]